MPKTVTEAADDPQPLAQNQFQRNNSKKVITHWQLPAEVWTLIFHYLWSWRDLKSCLACCKRFQLIISENARLCIAWSQKLELSCIRDSLTGESLTTLAAVQSKQIPFLMMVKDVDYNPNTRYFQQLCRAQEIHNRWSNPKSWRLEFLNVDKLLNLAYQDNPPVDPKCPELGASITNPWTFFQTTEMLKSVYTHGSPIYSDPVAPQWQVTVFLNIIRDNKDQEKQIIFVALIDVSRQQWYVSQKENLMDDWKLCGLSVVQGDPLLVETLDQQLRIVSWCKKKELWKRRVARFNDTNNYFQSFVASSGHTLLYHVHEPKNNATNLLVICVFDILSGEVLDKFQVPLMRGTNNEAKLENMKLLQRDHQMYLTVCGQEGIWQIALDRNSSWQCVTPYSLTNIFDSSPDLLCHDDCIFLHMNETPSYAVLCHYNEKYHIVHYKKCNLYNNDELEVDQKGNYLFVANKNSFTVVGPNGLESTLALDRKMFVYNVYAVGISECWILDIVWMRIKV